MTWYAIVNGERVSVEMPEEFAHELAARLGAHNVGCDVYGSGRFSPDTMHVVCGVLRDWGGERVAAIRWSILGPSRGPVPSWAEVAIAQRSERDEDLALLQEILGFSVAAAGATVHWSGP